MTEEPVICEDVLPANLRALAAGVIVQAVKDLTGGRPWKRVSAFMWLTSSEFEIWSDFAGAWGDIDIYRLLGILHLPRVKRKLNLKG